MTCYRAHAILSPTILVAIYDLYSSGIFAYAYRLLGEANLAEDCVSETFLRFLKMLKNKTGPRDHLKAYLYRIAHNWITDVYRDKTNRVVELTDTLNIQAEKCLEDLVDQKLDHSHLRSAIMTLTPDQRFVITLRFIEGWDINQVAVAMGKPTGAVKALQHRAMSVLQLKLNANEVANETR